MTLAKTELVAWMLGALDPDREAEVAEAVARSQPLQRLVRELQPRLSEWREAPTRTWNIPPPGLSRASAAPVLSAPEMTPGQLRPGARFAIRIPDREDPASWQVVVLSRGPADWEVRFPTSPDERLLLDELPRAEDGSRLLNVSAGAAEGLQRWAVALAPRELPVGWARPDPERWSELATAIQRGELPVTTVEVKVAARR